MSNDEIQMTNQCQNESMTKTMPRPKTARIGERERFIAPERLAVGRVSRPTSSTSPSHGLIFGLAACQEKADRNVFGGTPNTARGTHALPEIAVARSEERRVGKECRSRW